MLGWRQREYSAQGSIATGWPHFCLPPPLLPGSISSAFCWNPPREASSALFEIYSPSPGILSSVFCHLLISLFYLFLSAKACSISLLSHSSQQPLLLSSQVIESKEALEGLGLPARMELGGVQGAAAAAEWLASVFAQQEVFTECVCWWRGNWH